MTVQMFFTVYYAEKGGQMLQLVHFLHLQDKC